MQWLLRGRLNESTFFMITDYVQIGTLIIGIVTAWVLIQTFRRDRKHELGNQLYKTKLEALSNLSFELNNFFNLLDYCIMQLEILEDTHEEELIRKKIIEMSLFMDKGIQNCQSEILRYIVFFPDKSTENLLDFSSNLEGKIEWDASDFDSLTDIIEKYYQAQLTRADKAIEDLRAELQLNKLHTSLFKRLK